MMDWGFLIIILTSLSIPHISPALFKIFKGKHTMHTQLLKTTLNELAEVEQEINRFCTLLRSTPIEQVNTLAWIRESLATYQDAHDELRGRISLITSNSINLH